MQPSTEMKVYSGTQMWLELRGELSWITMLGAGHYATEHHVSYSASSSSHPLVQLQCRRERRRETKPFYHPEIRKRVSKKKPKSKRFSQRSSAEADVKYRERQ